MNALTFTTTIDTNTNKPIDYTITGSIVLDMETVCVGFTTADKARALDELFYWAEHADSCVVTFKKTAFN